MDFGTLEVTFEASLAATGSLLQQLCNLGPSKTTPSVPKDPMGGSGGILVSCGEGSPGRNCFEAKCLNFSVFYGAGVSMVDLLDFLSRFHTKSSRNMLFLRWEMCLTHSK